jgi:two-component system phosphate regulon sensor histidine kinase PhoR
VPSRAQACSVPETAKLLLETMPLPCLLVGGQARIAFANDRARDLFQMPGSGQKLADLVPAPEIVEAVTATQADRTAKVVRFGLRMPVEHWFEAHVAALRLPDDGGTSEFVLITLNDLTQQQRIERMRADFVANASHELRTPLASLLGFIETLQGPARDEADTRDRFLAVMKTQAERMSRLINDLLSLSRIEVSEHLRPKTRIDLREVIPHVRDALSSVAQENQVDIAVALPPEPLFVFGERDELVRVFENLIENAIKYGASGKRIEITGSHADVPKPQAVVAVRDFGPGIPPEHVPRLTERFYRVDVRESRQKGGTGLGLALVKHILNRHRGTLAIDSEPGRGSTFTVRLDLAGGALAELSASPPAVS